MKRIFQKIPIRNASFEFESAFASFISIPEASLLAHEEMNHEQGHSSHPHRVFR
jgi:hypothetical protein